MIGDPLDVIASGPTVANRTTAADALAVLQKFATDRKRIPQAVWSALETKSRGPAEASVPENVVNVVIGNNERALAAAAEKAGGLGYAIQSLGSVQHGIARDVGRELAERARQNRDASLRKPGQKTCILSGGETVVPLAATDQPRKGGRNQELVLGAVATLWADGMHGMAVLSGGTDGEDGPTDAAGAVADADLLDEAKRLGLAPEPYLAINNSYAFFERTGGLLMTGPTQTNVMDVQVILVDPQ